MFMTAAAFAVSLGITPALAQQTQTAPPGETGPPAASHEQLNAQLVGKPVWTSDGKQAGIVSEVLTGPDGKIEALHVTLGDFLGLGERMVRVSADLLATDGEKLQVTLSAEELGMLPEVARNA
jgi:hypothetical protein